jgi:hypothetical protein
LGGPAPAPAPTVDPEFWSSDFDDFWADEPAKKPAKKRKGGDK